MRDKAHKLFHKYLFILLGVFACLISFSQTYAENHINDTRLKILKSLSEVEKIQGNVFEIAGTTTPLLINLTESKARITLLQKGLKLRVASRRQHSSGKGLIVSQNPKAGTRVRLGQTVFVDILMPLASRPLAVSISPPLHTVVQGSSVVFRANYNKKNVRLNWQLNGLSGNATNFKINTKSLKPGSYVVSLVVAESPQINVLNVAKSKRATAKLIVRAAPVVGKSVPNVVNLSRSEANSIIRKSGLNTGRITKKATTNKAFHDIVSNQRPSAGQKLKAGAKVDLWVYELKQALEPLRINITPSKQIIEQGRTITFLANSKTTSLTYSWSGAGQSSKTNNFVIKTDRLSPKNYPITLKVWDRNKRTAIARAVLQIKKKSPPLIPVPDVTQSYRINALALLQKRGFKQGKINFETRNRGHNDWVLKQQPAAGTKVLPNSRIDLIVSKHPPLPSIEVRINPPNQVIEQGKEVTFVAESENELTSYRWEGAGKISNGERFIIQSQNLPTENYQIKLTVGDRHKRTKTALATLQVIKPETILIPVPNVNSLKLDDAIRQLKENRLNTGNLKYRETTTENNGKVVEQTPKAGVKVKPGSTVDLWISKKKIQSVLIPVPDLIGEDIKSAHEILTEIDLLSGSITDQAISSGEPGRVLEQTPKAGVEVKLGSKVDLWVSKKEVVPVLINVPNLIGQNFEIAHKILTEEGLSGSITNQVVSTGEVRKVLEQSPAAMTQVKKGSVVNMVISSVFVDPDVFILELNVENSRHLLGKATRFLLKPSDPASVEHYWLELDEEQSSDRFIQTSYEHVFNQIGVHSVFAKTRVNGEVYQSEPVNIWVLPTWLIPITAGLGLLSLGAGVVKSTSSSKAKVVNKHKTTRISIKPITDYGSQKISRVSLVEVKGSDIDGQKYHTSVGFDNALNEGEWEVLIDENNRKINGNYSDE